MVIECTWQGQNSNFLDFYVILNAYCQSGPTGHIVKWRYSDHLHGGILKTPRCWWWVCKERSDQRGKDRMGFCLVNRRVDTWLLQACIPVTMEAGLRGVETTQCGRPGFIRGLTMQYSGVTMQAGRREDCTNWPSTAGKPGWKWRTCASLYYCGILSTWTYFPWTCPRLCWHNVLLRFKIPVGYNWALGSLLWSTRSMPLAVHCPTKLKRMSFQTAFSSVFRHTFILKSSLYALTIFM